MKKFIKCSLSLMLASTMLIGAFGCNKGSSESSADIESVEFWGAYATEKILQDNLELYTDKKPASINLQTVKGETESYQIIMTTDEDAVTSYDVKTSDLVSGENTLKAQNISVYHEKYIELTGAGEYYKEAGWYPDAIVPFANIKDAKENRIEANNNQGLFVSFSIPKTQPEGVYTGNIEIVIGGESKLIPVSIDVGNASISEETHTQSVFMNEWHMSRGEIDTSAEMYDAYNKMLFKYRIGCNDLIYRNKHTDKEIQRYAEIAVEYALIDECPAYNIPNVRAEVSTFDQDIANELINRYWGGSPAEDVTPKTYDPKIFERYFIAMAYEGLEQGVDTFKKAVIYGYDEPDLNKVPLANLQAGGYVVKQTKEKVIAMLLSDTSIENVQLRDQIIESLRAVPHVITSSSYLSIDWDLSVEDMVYCPEFQFIENSSLQDKYRMDENNQLWWYGCVNPDYPYPTYHIDDTLISARLLSWMQADYNIQGNIYWATNSYSGKTNEQAQNNYLEDYYDRPAYNGSNGEGFLFYPGKKYGIDGPVATIRLEAIRDGLEEYEFIYYLEKLYKELGESYGVSDIDANKVLDRLYYSMYSGTQVRTTEQVFEDNRARLIGLLNLANSQAGVLVTDVTESQGNMVYKVAVKDGYEISVSGNLTPTTQTLTGAKLYTYTVSAGQLPEFKISYENEQGKQYGFSLPINSSSNVYDASYLENIISSGYSNEIETAVVQASTVVAEATGNWLKLDLTKAIDSKPGQHFVLKDDSVIKKWNKDTDKAIIRIYNPTDKEIEFNLQVAYGGDMDGNKPYYTRIIRDNLKPGENSITINNISSLKWRNVKYIHSLRMVITGTGLGANETTTSPNEDIARTLYLMDMSVYMK